jgi:ATP-dependent Lon protease
MEIIELSSYTVEEKMEITKRYLIPKQLKANGLTGKNAHFTDGGVQFTIEGYTRESGVRTLERTVGTLCRKIAVEYADDKTLPPVKVDKKQVEKLLGTPRFTGDEERNADEIGAVTGLAWTAVGGTTLTVEACLVDGKGEMKLTGKLGDVMKESATAALTFIRANAEKYGINSEIFKTKDLHVHVPEGATPKDGPSAGITMATAMLSAYTGKAVRSDVAMTGEITLRGKVLPIGGLKEKSLAARRVGIKTVIMPFGNKRDLQDIPEKIREEIQFIPVERVEEVFAVAFRDFERENDLLSEAESGAEKVVLPRKNSVKRMPKKSPVARRA